MLTAVPRSSFTRAIVLAAVMLTAIVGTAVAQEPACSTTGGGTYDVGEAFMLSGDRLIEKSRIEEGSRTGLQD